MRFAPRPAGPPTRRRCWSWATSDWESRLAAAPDTWQNFPTHRDDPAIWLFSGGTTGRPKAAVQPHRSYVNTAQCYARHVLCYTEDDVTLSVPKLYFGYAMGSNLLFPFAAGATSVLFDERCTADAIFSRIARYRPTVLITVPTMINQMVSHPEAGRQDLSSLRVGHLRGRGPAGGAARAGGTGRSAFRSSTDSAPRSSGTSSSPTAWAASAAGRWARWCPGSRSRWRTRRAGRCPTARWAISGCAAARGRWATGSSSTRARPASAASGW